MSDNLLDLPAIPFILGQANDQCIAFFTESLQVSQAKVKIIRGQYGREKLIQVAGMRSDEVLARLDPTPRPQ